MDRKQPLYSCIPRWITSIVETKKCYKCKTPVSRKNICAIGIRSIGAAEDNHNTVYVEHACSKCEARTVTSFSKEQMGTVEHLCYMLIGQVHNNRRVQKARQLEDQFQGGQIGEEEADSLVKFMEDSESFDDLLKYIGAPELPPDPKKKKKVDKESESESESDEG